MSQRGERRNKEQYHISDQIQEANQKTDISAEISSLQVRDDSVPLWSCARDLGNTG